MGHPSNNSIPEAGIRPTSLVLFLLCVLCFVPVRQAQTRPVEPVIQCQPSVIEPGQQTVFSFTLTQPATVTTTIVGPDGLAILTPIDHQPRPAGTVTILWDGRDTSGTPVPDEAYSLAVELQWDEGTTTTIDPWQNGGGRLPVTVATETSESGIVLSYTLPVAARVTIRAGIHSGGPLLRTIVGGEPQPAGTHRIVWDGLDDTGHIRVTDMEKWGVTITAVGLPSAAVLVTGNGGDYLTYRTQRQRDGRRPQTAAGLPTFRGSATPRFAVYGRSQPSRAAQSLGTPRHPLAGPNPIPVSGIFDLSVVIDETYQAIFDDNRFETVVFIDGKRFDEEENAFSPYTYHLDTRRLTNGIHLVTINQVGIAGEIGSYSLTLDVQN